MKVLLFLGLSCITLSTRAQIQFWSTNDVENAQWQSAYAVQKVKKVTTYKVDERSNRLFPDMPESIKVYDTSGHTVTSRRNKYDWSKKAPQLLSADSLFYNSKGQLIKYSAYDGPRMNYVADVEFFYNAKGQQIRQDNYEPENYVRKKSGSEILTYSPAGRAVKLVSKNTMSVLDHTRKFSYDTQGHLTEATFTSDGNTITTYFRWNDKGLLLGYNEKNGPNITEVSFIYDDKGRRISRHTEIGKDYRDNTTYIYRAQEMLPYISHTTYPGNTKDDIRFENIEYEYEFHY